MRWIVLALLALSASLAACGDPAPRPATRAENARSIPFAGRDEKEVISAFGEGGRDIIEHAASVELLTLNPHQLVDGKLSPETDRLRGYGVLGRVTVTDDTEHRSIVEAVYRGLKGEGAGPASCFWPRHALRFTHDGRTVELLICFECTWVHVYRDGAEHEARMLFGAGVKPVFDSAVKAHGLTLHKGN
ncbi:MAG: hypothetical protein O2894_09700 [Planctomycetota bacterium]|nr:hypothetical protein [Planctomycetota bacterium]